MTVRGSRHDHSKNQNDKQKKHGDEESAPRECMHLRTRSKGFPRIIKLCRTEDMSVGECSASQHTYASACSHRFKSSNNGNHTSSTTAKTHS